MPSALREEGPSACRGSLTGVGVVCTNGGRWRTSGRGVEVKGRGGAGSGSRREEDDGGLEGRPCEVRVVDEVMVEGRLGPADCVVRPVGGGRRYGLSRITGGEATAVVRAVSEAARARDGASSIGREEDDAVDEEDEWW